MIKKLSAFVLFVFCLSFFGEKIFAQNSTSKSIVLKINSKILNEERNISITLPDDYEQLPGDKFPVIYMLDGESKNSQMMSIIRNHLAGNLLISSAVLVSIPNTNRNRDLTPTKINQVPNSGGGDKFLDFVQKELFPEIEKNYRVQPYRIIAGHSFGGLTVIYTLFTRPEMFNAYLAASPTLTWDDNYLIKRAADSLKTKDNRNKILFVGLGDEPALINEFTMLKNEISKANPKNLDYEFKQIPDENHGSAIFLEYYYGLKTIYAGWSPIPKTFPLSKTWLAEMEAHFKQLSAKYGYKIEIPESLINAIGYGLLYQENRIDDAVAAFKKNVELYPESANAYDSLGEGYEVKENYPLARDNYEKAFKLAESKGDEQIAKSSRANYERVLKKIK